MIMPQPRRKWREKLQMRVGNKVLSTPDELLADRAQKWKKEDLDERGKQEWPDKKHASADQGHGNAGG